MVKFARVENDVVVEIVQIPNGMNISDCFHPEIAATMVECADDVSAGDIRDGDSFVRPTPDVVALKAAKAAILTAACAAAITGGYKSAALGAEYTYPSKPTDQTNMLGSVADSLLPNLPADWTTPFWCMDANGSWTFAAHTAVQIQQAGSDGKAWVVACQTLLAELNAQVEAATSITEIDNIAWPEAA